MEQALIQQKKLRGDIRPEDFAAAEQDIKQTAEKKSVKEKAKECVMTPFLTLADPLAHDVTVYRVELEAVERDISSLTAEEKLEILTAEAPELLALVQDFRAKVTQMRERVFPLIERIKAGEFKTCNGVSFLEVQFQLMLSYCINIAYYLYLKVDGHLS